MATNVMRFLLEALIYIYIYIYIYILIGNWFVLNSFKFLLGDVNTFNITEPHFAWHDLTWRHKLQDHFEVPSTV
jgi:hypothetical protein